MPALSVPANSAVEVQLASIVGAAGGSAVWGGLKVEYDWTQGIMGQVVIENKQQGIIFDLALLGGYRYDALNTLYAPWWLPDANTNGFVTLFNASDQKIQVSPSITAQGSEQSLDSIELAPHQTKQIGLRDAMHERGFDGSNTGVITLRYTGPAHALLPALLLSSAQTGFSLAPNFNAKRPGTPTQTTWSYPDVFLSPDPSLGFDIKDNLTAYALLSNRTNVSLTPHIVAHVPGQNGICTKNVTLPVTPLEPGDTRLVNLSQFVTSGLLPKESSHIALSVTHAGEPGDLAITVFSVGQTKNFVFTSEGTVHPSTITDSSYWDIEGNLVALLSVQNTGQTPAQGRATLYYPTPNGTGSYVLPLINVAPGGSQILNLNQIVQSGKPDANGSIIPQGTTWGSMRLETAGPNSKALLFGGTTSFDPVAGGFGFGIGPFCDGCDPDCATCEVEDGIGTCVPSCDDPICCPVPPPEPPPPVPSSLQVLSVTVLPDGIGAPHGCPGSLWYGILVDIKYQVFGSDGSPFQQGGMTPHETGTSFTGAALNSNIGPSPGFPTSTGTTASDGTFHDVPFGICANGAITKTATQNITIIMSGTSYPVRSQTFTVNGQSVGHGTISNNIGDIAATR